MPTTRFLTLRHSSVLVARTLDANSRTIWPITAKELKATAQTDLADDEIEDVLLDGDAGLIAEATEYVENRAGVALVNQTRRLYIDGQFPDDDIDLDPFPVSAVASVKYLDTDYTETTLATSVWKAALNGSRPRVILKYNQNWPTDLSGDAECIYIDFTAGYGATAASVPARWKRCVKILATYMFEHSMPGVDKTDEMFRAAFDKELAMAGAEVRYR